MSARHPEIVVVRRRGALEDAHHGGAWKIAFADFMTAMMAFFLVLWIISANAGPGNPAAERTYVCAVIRNMVPSGFARWTANPLALCR